MNRIAKFEKVSYEQFKTDSLKAYPYLTEEDILIAYKNIKLPKRSTTGSAGYDFFLPFNILLSENKATVIPTGIRCKIEDGWVLKCYPRSGHGFKYGIRLANTVGIIDADYYNAENEGHIQIKLVNDSKAFQKEVKFNDINLAKESAFCQGIFIPFGITVDDEADGIRIGGFGSTDKDK